MSMFSLFCLNGLSQQNLVEKSTKTPINSNLRTGVNYSWYKNSIGNYGLRNFEINFGYSLDRAIFKNVKIQIQTLLGVKVRKPYDYRFNLLGKNTSNSISNPLYAFSEVDKFDKVLNRNHYYIELPLNIGYTINHLIEPFIGYGLRYYFPSSNNNDDFISSSVESGIITGLSYRPSKKVVIGGNIYFGMSNSYSQLVHIQTENIEKTYSSILKSRSVQLFLIYRFN